MRTGLLNFKPPKPKFDITNPVPFVLSALRKEAEITKVELAAVLPYEISIEVSEEKLLQFGLTIGEVANAVRRASQDLPGGSVKTSAGEVVIRALGKPDESWQFGEIVVISRPDGSVVRLREIARVIDGFAEVEIDLLKRNGTWGLVLVFLVLALFLRPSLAFLVALGIPVSFAGGIWLMPQMGISINMISLFAFILVLGIVVDDAIIVGENVYRRMRSGEGPKEASWRGTHEVGMVVIFGVLTTMMAFTPMLGLSGVSGKIWPNIPLIVIPTLMFSLVQSKLVG